MIVGLAQRILLRFKTSTIPARQRNSSTKESGHDETRVQYDQKPHSKSSYSSPSSSKELSDKNSSSSRDEQTPKFKASTNPATQKQPTNKKCIFHPTTYVESDTHSFESNHDRNFINTQHVMAHSHSAIKDQGFVKN
jgi:hypothetical protein